MFPKSDFNIGSEQGLLNKFVAGPNVIIISGDHWKSQRKVINPAFRRSMPVKLFGQLTQELFETIQVLGGTVDVSDLMMRCTLDAIGRAGFGIFCYKYIFSPLTSAKKNLKRVRFFCYQKYQ